MGASRTLQRKLKVDQNRRSKPENITRDTGVWGRRLIVDERIGAHEHTFHATKGHRYRRVEA